MKLIMDADCLIKLTKAKLKEAVCGSFKVVIPREVKQEVVDDGAGHPDATAVKNNLESGGLEVSRRKEKRRKGEDAALAAFMAGNFDAVCSDDKRFVRKLRALGVPYITPTVLVVLLAQMERLSYSEGRDRLGSLRPFVSDDEYAVTMLKLESLMGGGGAHEDKVD